MKRISIIVLYLALAALLIVTIGICTMSSYLMFFDNQPPLFMTAMFFVGSILAAVPFCFVLYQCTVLLRWLSRPKPIAADMVGLLTKIIKELVAVLGAGILFGLPVLFSVAKLEEAPGVGAFGLLLIFAIMTFTAIAYLIRDALKHRSDDQSTE